MPKNTISANKILAFCPLHNSLHIPDNMRNKKVENTTAPHLIYNKYRIFELSNLSNLLHIAYLNKILGNLHRIESRSLAYLVAGEPQCYAAVVGKVFAYTTDIDIILASTFKRHRIDIVLRVIFKSHARCLQKSLANLLHRKRFFGLNPYRLGM